MGGAWNISLFNYRNHGADFGRVLVGMQVPTRDIIEAFLTLAYIFWYNDFGFERNLKV
jgi:threonine dehydratase